MLPSALDATEPLDHIVQSRLPAGEGRERAGIAPSRVAASGAFQQNLVLPKMIAQLVDYEGLHARYCT
jgi:hypothetical protein